MKLKCPKCQFIQQDVNHFQDCPQCNEPMELYGDIYINTYLVDRAYGGPEEGGWYYTCGDPVDSRLCSTRKEVYETQSLMEEWCRENNDGRRPISSALSTGIYETRMEEHFARPWPQYKPYYE